MAKKGALYHHEKSLRAKTSGARGSHIRQALAKLNTKVISERRGGYGTRKARFSDKGYKSHAKRTWRP